MRRRWPRVLATLTGCLLLSACPAADQSADRSATSSAPSPVAPPTGPRPALGTDASIGLPAYTGPPAGGPPSAGPIRTLAAAVDLTPAAPGSLSRVRFAVATPDGGAYVVLGPDGTGPPQQLGIVRPTAGGYRVTSSVPVPLLEVWGLHLLADGRVALTGPLDPTGDAPTGYGFAVVDPVTGAARTTAIVSFGPPPALALGRSALAPDGRTLFLFLSVGEGAGPRERLVAADAISGVVLSDRDLSNDVAGASRAPAGRDVAGLVPRPGGGVTLVLDATPDATRLERIPTLLVYDRTLRPAGDPVRVTSAAEAAQTEAVAGGVDGTVFLVVKVPGGAWILAVPDAGGAGPVLVQLADTSYDYALLVEPAQVWGLLPAQVGARAVDLTRGTVSAPVDVRCPGLDVRAMFPGSGGVGALLVGECNTPRTRTQMLWILRP
ncbi:MAG: hypothetical protein ACXVX3_18275 [Blastococcus sp.]